MEPSKVVNMQKSTWPSSSFSGDILGSSDSSSKESESMDYPAAVMTANQSDRCLSFSEQTEHR